MPFCFLSTSLLLSRFEEERFEYWHFHQFSFPYHTLSLWKEVISLRKQRKKEIAFCYYLKALWKKITNFSPQCWWTLGQWWAAKMIDRKQLFFLRPSQTTEQWVMEKTNRENYKEQSWQCQKLYRYWFLPFSFMYLRYSTAGQLESLTVWHFIKCTVLTEFASNFF